MHVNAEQDTETEHTKTRPPPLLKARERERRREGAPGWNVNVAAYRLEGNVKALETEKSDERLMINL